MKTVRDLIFHQYIVDPSIELIDPTYAAKLSQLKHAELTFPNGYSISVLFGYLHPTLTKIGYSLAVFKDGERVHNTGLDRQCTTGEEIDCLIFDVQCLK